LYQHFKNRKRAKDEQNEILRVRFQQTSLSCMNIIFFFSFNNQCQPTKLLKPDSSIDELRNYLLTVIFFINYIDESCIPTKFLMTTNESCYIPRHELSSSKFNQF